jgi:hypothetical protein
MRVCLIVYMKDCKDKEFCQSSTKIQTSNVSRFDLFNSRLSLIMPLLIIPVLPLLTGISFKTNGVPMTTMMVIVDQFILPFPHFKNLCDVVRDDTVMTGSKLSIIY